MGACELDAQLTLGVPPERRARKGLVGPRHGELLIPATVWSLHTKGDTAPYAPASWPLLLRCLLLLPSRAALPVCRCCPCSPSCRTRQLLLLLLLLRNGVYTAQ